MKKSFAVAAVSAATLTFATGASAAGSPYCGTYATPSITAPTTEAGEDCQAAIVKNTQKFAKSMLKIRGKCLLEGVIDACPNTDDDEKVQSAANKATEAIASACGATASGLGSSYNGETGSNVGSCTLSQDHGTLEVYLGETHGTSGFPAGSSGVDNLARQECQEALSKAAQKYLPAVLKAVDKCVQGKIKAGETMGIGAACVGALAPGGHTAPTDTKTADAISKATEKMQASLDKGCTGITAAQAADLFGCPGATSADDLDECVECSGLNAVFEIVEHQYTETGEVISGTIQAAVDGGGPGDKFLIPSGNYVEAIDLPPAHCSVTLMTSCLNDGDCPMGETCVSLGDDMQFVGCGAASDNCPRIIPTLGVNPVVGSQGFASAGVDGLHYEGLDVSGWPQDGIFATDAQGISFRDMYGDGDNLLTPAVDSINIYILFPVVSDDVLVEGSEVTNCRDAGIYVGQSTNIVVRHNLVYRNVTGIEIENSEFAEVYSNTAFGNTGGLLSFKLPGPPIQESGDHNFFDNVSFSNNELNFGIPGTTVGNVPMGTGFMIISEDDTTFENNIVESNDSYGFVTVDQDAVNILLDDGNPMTPPLFDPVSADQDVENLRFIDNKLPANGPRKNGENAPLGTQFPNNYTLALAGGINGTCFDPVPGAGERSPGSPLLSDEAFNLCP